MGTTDGPMTGTQTGQHAVVAADDSESESVSELETILCEVQGGAEEMDAHTAGHDVLTDEDDEANLLHGRQGQVQRKANDWAVFDDAKKAFQLLAREDSV